MGRKERAAFVIAIALLLSPAALAGDMPEPNQAFKPAITAPAKNEQPAPEPAAPAPKNAGTPDFEQKLNNLATELQTQLNALSAKIGPPVDPADVNDKIAALKKRLDLVPTDAAVPENVSALQGQLNDLSGQVDKLGRQVSQPRSDVSALREEVGDLRKLLGKLTSSLDAFPSASDFSALKAKVDGQKPTDLSDIQKMLWDFQGRLTTAEQRSQQGLTKEDVQKLIAEALAANNQQMDGRLTQIKSDSSAEIRAQVAQLKQQPGPQGPPQPDPQAGPKAPAAPAQGDSRHPDTPQWKTVSACLQGLGLTKEQFWSDSVQGDPLPHAKLTASGAEQLRAAGKLDAAKACVASRG